MKIISSILIWVVTITFAHAIELKQFGSYKSANNEQITVSFIDLSQFSLNWLDKNREYLIEKQIPILVINTQEEDKVKNLYKIYSEENDKLLIALAPEPVEFTEQIYKKLDIRYFPSVYENGVVWQEKRQ